MYLASYDKMCANKKTSCDLMEKDKDKDKENHSLGLKTVKDLVCSQWMCHFLCVCTCVHMCQFSPRTPQSLAVGATCSSCSYIILTL